MKNTTYTSLVLLGNGFDLNCGLNSKFSHFFKDKVSNASIAADTRYNTVCSNFWYLLLYFKYYDETYYENEHLRVFQKCSDSDPLWMDVEGFIKQVVSFDKTQDNWMRMYFPGGISNYLQLFSSLFQSRFQSIVIGERNQHNSIRKFFKSRFLSGNQIDICEFLYQELVKFENDFKEYLKTDISNSEDYPDNYSRLLGYIISDEYFSIITFNYTPFLGSEDTKQFLSDCNNVHGDLSSEIIIGYDSSDLNENNMNCVKMCKAWQKMNFTKAQYKLPTKGKIDSIKIYGHSLGSQDYSYFHSIFDYYDLYNSSIKLVFYYTEHGESASENDRIRSNYLSQIYNLLNSYAYKSGNERIVKTIISRLQLENRLLIETVPVIKKTRPISKR